MKKLLSVALCLVIALTTFSALGETSPTFNAGTYTTTAYGMGGAYTLSMTFSENEILSIDASDNHETLMVGTEAIRILSERIIENQSLDLDAVSSATVSSYSFIRAVEDCVRQSGTDVDTLKAKTITVDTYDDEPHDADVIVIGGGLAGLSTAANCVKNGLNVILLEQRGFMGGHSVLAAGTLSLGGTKLQADLGIEDSEEEFTKFMLDFGQGDKDPEQVRLVAEHAQDAYDFVIDMGGNFDTELITLTEGRYCGHSLEPNIGAVFSTMATTMVDMGVDVRYNTRVYDLITDESGAVTGVKATDYYGNETEYYGKSIVLASGGYAGNKKLLLEYWGEKYQNLVYGGLTGTDGLLIEVAMALGADTVDMDNPHLDACADLNTGITITAALSTKGGAITVRPSTAQRIANESANHAEDLAATMLEIADPWYVIIYDDTAFDVSSSLSYKAGFYNDSGLVHKYESVESLAEAYDMDAATLQQTIDDYNAAVRGEKKDEFGRVAFNKEISAPFYATKVTNGVTTTTGGLKVNAQMQVINVDGEPIENLYAAGEATGGFRIHYISGSSLTHGIVSGIAISEVLSEK